MKKCCEWRDCDWEPEWEVSNHSGKKLSCSYHLSCVVEPLVRNVLTPYITLTPAKVERVNPIIPLLQGKIKLPLAA